MGGVNLTLRKLPKLVPYMVYVAGLLLNAFLFRDSVIEVGELSSGLKLFVFLLKDYLIVYAGLLLILHLLCAGVLTVTKTKVNGIERDSTEIEVLLQRLSGFCFLISGCLFSVFCLSFVYCLMN